MEVLTRHSRWNLARASVKSPGKQLKFVIRSLGHDGELLQKTRRQPSGAFGSLQS
jgi:hypothetical protein